MNASNLTRDTRNESTPQPNQSESKKEAITSKYRGVTHNKNKGTWRAKLSFESRSYELGFYVEEEDAARAYDMARICARGLSDQLNFPVSDYVDHAQGLQKMDLDDVVADLRSKAVAALPSDRKPERRSQYQGIRFKEERGGKWEVVINIGGRHVYLGMYDTDKEAAHAYDQGVLLRWGQGIGTAGGARTSNNNNNGELPYPTLNFPATLYEKALVDQNALDGDENNNNNNNSSVENPNILNKRYAESVVQACKNYYKTADSIINALEQDKNTNLLTDNTLPDLMRIKSLLFKFDV